MIEKRSGSPEQTRQFGKKMATFLSAGDTVLLQGELGAGKTEFVKGIAEGLGVAERVTSPTFTLLHVYQGTMPVYHFDLYRLVQPEELFEIGFEDYHDGVTIIEWPERFPREMPTRHFAVDFLLSDQIDERIITIKAVGSHYQNRLEGREDF